MKVSFVFHRMQPKQNLEVSRMFLFFSIIGYSLIIAKRSLRIRALNFCIPVIF